MGKLMSAYKDTINLPKTRFSMKANLAQRELQMLQHWREIDLYNKIRTYRAGAKKVYLARWAALCKRCYPSRSCGQQDIKRYYYQVQGPGRFLMPLMCQDGTVTDYRLN